MLIVARLIGPIGSPYPGIPIVVAFVCFLIAVGIRSAQHPDRPMVATMDIGSLAVLLSLNRNFMLGQV